jgi:putative transposase
MGRAPRTDVGNYVYHIINRANGRARIFHNEDEYSALESILAEAKEIHPMRILAYCVMPNHWHMVVCPKEDGDLSRFMQWVTLTHTQRYRSRSKSRGYGHLYQGRYKSFLVAKDSYFLHLCRYVEQNPLRAKLVKKAEDWKWSSAWRRIYGTKEQQALLSSWPIDKPHDYKKWLNTKDKDDDEQLTRIRESIRRGRPYGEESWVARMIDIFDLESTMRNHGRPKKGT